ncbi:hypothetical protein ACFVX3_31350 [Rhodococcus erythropolis]
MGLGQTVVSSLRIGFSAKHWAWVAPFVFLLPALNWSHTWWDPTVIPGTDRFVGMGLFMFVPPEYLRIPTVGIYLWVFTLAAASTLVLFGWKKWKVLAADTAS